MSAPQAMIVMILVLDPALEVLGMDDIMRQVTEVTRVMMTMTMTMTKTTAVHKVAQGAGRINSTWMKFKWPDKQCWL